MENKNNKKNIIIILLSILVVLLLIISIFLGYLVFGNENDKKEDIEITDNNSGDNKKEEEEKPEELSINDSVVVDLYKMTRVSAFTTGGIFEEPYKNQKLTVDEMSDFYRAGIAANLYNDKVVSSDEIGSLVYVSENYVKEAYNQIFGEGYYNTSVPIHYHCMPLAYDSNNNRFTANWIPCGLAGVNYSIDRVIKAVKYSDRIEITAVVWFNDLEEGVYVDVDGNKKLGIATADPTNETEITGFVDKYKEQLQHYTHTFKLNENGSYNYYSIERTKN